MAPILNRKATAVALLALALAAPVAAHAVPEEFPTRTQVNVAPFGTPTPYGEPRETVADVRYCHHVSGGLALGPTVVRLSLTDVPDWVDATVAPRLIRVTPQMPESAGSMVCAPEETVTVTAVVANASAVDVVIRLEAHAFPNPPLGGSQGGASFLVDEAFDATPFVRVPWRPVDRPGTLDVAWDASPLPHLGAFTLLGLAATAGLSWYRGRPRA